MSNIGGGNLGTASYIITGNAQGAVNAARQTQGALNELGNVVANNWWGIQNLGRAFAALPAVMAAGAGYAVKAASDMEDAVFQIQRTSGLTGEALDQVVNQVQAVARTTPIATTELAELAATGAALGVPNEALAEFARIMGVLITSTNLTAESADDLARAMNILQVPNSQMERFATTLLEIGRNTAATESEILNITKRIAPAARAAGITADQVLSLGAAILSLGPRAEAGGTAFNKTIGDMARSVSAGVNASNKQLALFADIAGVSAQDFAREFTDAPAQAFAKFITGLGRVEGGLTNQIRVLDALGIKEVRQAQALTALAGGTLAVGNEQRDLNAILAAGNRFWDSSNALTDINAQRAATLSGQMQLLKNTVFEAASGFGNALLPVLKPVIQFLGDLIRGISLLPAPLRTGVAVVGVLTGVLSGLIAAFVLVVPRILLARDAFIRIQVAMAQFRGGAAATSASMGATGAAAGRMATQIGIATQQIKVSASQVAAINGNLARWTTTTTAAGAASAATGAKVAKAATGFGKFAKLGGIAGTVLTVGTIALGVATARMGAKQREAAGDTAELTDATLGLAAADGDLNEELLETEDNARKASKAARELQERLEGVAQAHLAYVDAQREQQAATNALAEAQEKYEQAQEDQADNSREIRRAELDLSSARTRHRRSIRNLAQAEFDLANARDNAEADIEEAEDNLADARDKQLDIADRLVEMEERLVGLRGDDYLDELTEATNDLRNAELRLIRAHRGVEDAEWQLNYLREEGASPRDIADAELILAEARQEVADSEADMAESTEELNELRDETRRQREIASLERDIASAKRDGVEVTRDIASAERELGQLRERFASGEYLVEAQEAYDDALLGVEEALNAVAEAEQKLADLRAGFGAREVENAQRDYVSALYAVAKANMEARKQQALMRGEIFDAGDEAHVMAEELRKLADSVPDAGVRQQLLDFANILGRAPNVPDPVKEADPAAGAGGGGGGGAGGGIPIGEALMDGVQQGIENKKPEVRKSLFDTIHGAAGGNVGIGASIGGLIGAGLGSVIPGVGTLVGGALGTAIGAGLGATFNTWGPPLGRVLYTALGIGNLKEGFGTLKTVWGATMDFFSRKGKDTAGEVEKVLGKSTGNIVREAGFAEKALQQVFTSSEPITKEQTDKIIGHVNNMQSNTVHAAQQMADGQLASVKFLSEAENPIWNEIADTAKANIERQRTDTVAESEEMRKEIVAKIQALKDQGIPITQEMVTEITESVRGMRNENVRNVSEGSLEQAAIMRKLRAEGNTITREMASDIIKESARARDGAVQAAEQRYTRSVEEALKLERAGTITKEQADQIIGEARRQRDEAVSAANAQHTGVVNEIRNQRHDLNREMDAQTGDLRSRWDIIKNDAITKWKNGYDDFKRIGGDLIRGLIAGVKDAFLFIFKPQWNNFLDSIPGDFAKKFKIQSPSKVFAGFGANIVQGLANGILNEQTQLERAMQQITDALGDEFTANFGAQLQAFDLDYLTRNIADPLAGMTATAGAAGGAGQNVVNNYYETLNLEAITNADPEDIVNEYVWAKGVRARSRG